MSKKSFVLLLLPVLACFVGCSSSSTTPPPPYAGTPGVGSTFIVAHTDISGLVNYNYTVTALNTTGGTTPDTVWSSAPVQDLGVIDSVFTYIILKNGDVYWLHPGISTRRVWTLLPFGTQTPTDTLQETLNVGQTLYFSTYATGNGSGTDTAAGKSIDVQKVILTQSNTDTAGLSDTKKWEFEYAPSIGLFVGYKYLGGGGISPYNYHLVGYSLKN